MSKLKTLGNLITNPRQMTIFLATNQMLNGLSDVSYLKLMYWAFVGKKLNLENPVDYAEKIQWLKLNDRQEKYIEMVDKLAVKKYVAEKIGEEYIVPNIGVWDSFDQIDFHKMPKQFVLKCNHDSGSVIVCRDKTKFDLKAARKRITNKLKTDAYNWGREWPYKHVPRKVFAEKYLENDTDQTKDIIDYKFFCFNGVPKYCQVITDRSTNEKIDFFDMEWVHQPFVGLTPDVVNSKEQIEKPVNFDKMVEFATILSKNICFSRIDFFEVKGHLYFGEITLYPAAGFGWFSPAKWNRIMGNMIDLSLVDKKTGD